MIYLSLCVISSPPSNIIPSFPASFELVAQDVNLAMEASRKSRLAFAATSLGEAKSEEIVSSVKLALDFNFQDIE
ncbi:hypothetical protein SLEP1_g35951 [Rubroshorea leprosula]|uniref:CWZF3/5/7 THD domain-containing protein n=1 Tax=Rubroshorea leprosula TaxID=152421 RepID=A0AAV5KPV9_9ROSI|nr:hypothetical protein SLEP1_g35951 [Rubroshorea leprosula]